MPTDTQDEINASVSDVTPPETPEITDDTIKSHPLYQDLETKHAAARKGLDDKAKEVKRLKSALVDEEPEKVEEEVEKTGFNTEEKTLLKWEIKNENKIELCKEEYDKYVGDGVKPELALRLALDDKGITQDNISEHLRQISSGIPAASVDREAASEVTAEEKADMDQWGFSKETLKEHKQIKADRQKERT